MDVLCGVYQITNKTNGHRYVGSSKNIQVRFGSHVSKLKRGKHENSHLQHAWDKYGKDKFEFKVLLLCSEKDRFIYEQKLLDSDSYEYNIEKYAQSFPGMQFTDEHRKNISLSRIGMKLSEEHKRNIGLGLKGKYTGEKNSMYGKKHSKETLELLSKKLSGENHPLYGTKMPEARKRKIGKSVKIAWAKKRERGEMHPLLGKHRSQKVREKISKAHKGLKHSEETKQKIGEARMGHRHSEETKAKISRAHMGKKHTEETRLKISKALKECYANRKREKLAD